MSLSARQLRYLEETARLGSVHAAAKAMRISQSSIQAALEKAEAALGSRIFERHPARGVTTTPAGERFLLAARTLLSAHEDFERHLNALSTQPPKRIRIGCFEPFSGLFITDVLRRYVDAIGPVEFMLYEGDLVQLEGWLMSGTVDMVIAYDMGPVFKTALPIIHVPTHAVLHRSDPLAQAEVVSLVELAKRPLVLLDLPHTSTFLTTVFDIYATKPTISLRTRAYETVRSAVAAGFGASVLNLRPIASAARDPEQIVRRPIAEDMPPATLVVADNYGDLKPWFIAALIDEFRNFLHEVGPEGFAVCVPERRSALIPPAEVYSQERRAAQR